MECLEFRRAAGADPLHVSVEAAAHRDGCPKCAEFLRQTLVLDERILAALRVPVPVPERGAAAVAPPIRSGFTSPGAGGSAGRSRVVRGRDAVKSTALSDCRRPELATALKRSGTGPRSVMRPEVAAS